MFTGKSARRAAVALAVILCLVAFVSPAHAANSVSVESQVFMVGIPTATVGVSISNDDPLAGIVVPLEIRPLTPGAAIAQSILYQMNPAGRLANSPLGYADASNDSLWPEASRVLRQSCVVCSVSCSGPVSNSYCTYDTMCSYPTTPYGLFFGSVSTGDRVAGDSVNMQPGADPGTTAAASLQIVLNQLGTLPGFFEIDTACWMPANSITYARENSSLILPSFTKGTIELRCDCSCHADPVCDGQTNITDVVQAINVVFRYGDPGNQPYCPYQTVDANCDGLLDIVDVVTYIGVAFRYEDPSVLFCDPCDL
jgi:hypothetical protein